MSDDRLIGYFLGKPVQNDADLSLFEAVNEMTEEPSHRRIIIDRLHRRIISENLADEIPTTEPFIANEKTRYIINVFGGYTAWLKAEEEKPSEEQLDSETFEISEKTSRSNFYDTVCFYDRFDDNICININFYN